MKCQLRKIDDLCGSRATIYTIVSKELGDSLFNIFVKENKLNYPEEVLYLYRKLKSIANVTGATENFFEMFQGNYGDRVCYITDETERFRLYCIRLNEEIIVLGGGGYKHPDLHAYQEDKTLDKEAGFVKEAAKIILQRMINDEVFYSISGNELAGNLTFEINDPK